MPDHAELIHNIHTSREDAIGDAAFEAKLRSIRDTSEPLRLVYAGRADPDKGPIDFVEAVAAATRQGRQRPGHLARQRQPARGRCGAGADELELNDRLRLPGFTSDRDALLGVLRESHLMVHCHKVPESPRCLIESLVCGTPLLGYESAYSRDLTRDGQAEPPAGRHVRVHDAAALGGAIAELAADRGSSRRGWQPPHGPRADTSNDEDVFAHRCRVLKEHLLDQNDAHGRGRGDPEDSRPEELPRSAAG